MLYLMDQKYLARCFASVSSCFHQQPELVEIEELDVEVQSQREIISFMPKEKRSDYLLIYDEITKYFRHVIAVNQLFLSVEKGECFGILGTKGAGKSTVIKMALGDKIMSYGDIYVNGLSVRQEWRKIVWNCSFVPQYDGLFVELTGEENLQVYACIRGYNDARIENMIENLGDAFQLTEELKARVSTYSLGSKRKLSMAIALIGAPQVVFIDEPTRHIDPHSKHLLWHVIERLRQRGVTIILSSTDMDECKTLCSRFTIMTDGELKCMGSMRQLNKLFCNDLTLTIKLLPRKNRIRRLSIRQRSISTYRDVDIVDEADLQLLSDQAKELVMKNFPNSVLKQEFKLMLTFAVLTTDVQWSNVFTTLQNMQEELELEEFSLCLTKFEEKLEELTAEPTEEGDLSELKRKEAFIK